MKKCLLIYLFFTISLFQLNAQVSFNASTTSGCAPLGVNFTNTSTTGNYYQWEFGDGASFIGSNVFHTFNQAGNYQVRLSAYDTTGGLMNYLGDTFMGINVNGTRIETSADTVCPSDQISFYTFPYPSSTKWEFSDGFTSTQTQVDHTFSGPGTYTVKAIVNDQCGIDTLEKTVVVMVGAIPSAKFWPEPRVACPNDPVRFNVDNFRLASYEWDFGDGTMSTQGDPSHAYSAVGNYVVKLTVTDNCGTINNYTDTVKIQNNLNIQTFGLNINYWPQGLCPGDLVNFRTQYKAFKMQWSFGDGDSSSAAEPSHVYSSAGTYNVSLTFTNGCGNDTTVTTTVTVGNNNPFTGNISWNISPSKSACPGDPLFFRADLSATSYLWNFGDGSTSNQQDASHSYAAIGNYPISLTLVNGCGNDTTVYDTVIVTNTIVPILNQELWGAPEPKGCSGDSILFYGRGGTSYLWDFGDGTTTTQTTPLNLPEGTYDIVKHAYSALGTYTVKLTYTNGCGNSATDSLTVTIGTSEPANGGIIPMGDVFNACAPIKFLSLGGTSYVWDFGDGNIDTTSNSEITHSFPVAGVYDIKLTLTNGCGNSATDNRTLTILGMDMTGATTGVSCFGTASGSINISVTGGTAPLNYSWTNGSTTEDLMNVIAGNYSVMVTDTNGCSVTESFVINEPAVLGLSISATLASCGSADGSASVVASGGTGAYTYSWSNTANTATISNISAGIYDVVVTDENSCATQASVIVGNVGAPALTTTGTDALCYGTCTGSASVTTSGGTSPFGYSWSNGTIGDTNSTLCAGTYYLTVTDANNCQAIDSIVINEPSALTAIDTVYDATCFGTPTGAIDIFPSGGTNPYTYMISPGFSNVYLTAGNYTYVVTDANGCTLSKNFTVEQFDEIVPTINVNGSILTSSQGDFYQWYLNGNPISGSTEQTDTAIVTGYYQVMITDSMGCSGLSDSVYVVITGVKEISDKGIVVYPNPASDQISVVLSGNNFSEVQLSDLQGRIVYTARITANTSKVILPLTNIQQGLYQVIVRTDKDVNTFKVNVIK